MTNVKHHNLLILGSGPAGCTAAIYAARANLDFALITGLEQGGQLTKTPKIANWPGEPQEISGLDLMEKMLQQVRNFGVNIFSDNILQADLAQNPFRLQGGEDEYSCNALIIATGASARFLGLPSEEKYMGRGVSSCAVCDGFFYREKDVLIVGGGNTAVVEALYLSKIAKTVTVVHRRDSLRAEAKLLEQVKSIPNIKIEFNHVLEEILGDEAGVSGVKIKNVNSENIKQVDVTGVFMAIGHQPNTNIFTGQLELEKGYIKTGFGSRAATSVPGVFAAGDVVSRTYNQAIIAAGSGCTASLDAKDYLDSQSL